MASSPAPGAGLGVRIREAREACAWSQRQLAENANVSRPTIARIETGQHVRMSTLESVARVLGLEIELARPKA